MRRVRKGCLMSKTYEFIITGVPMGGDAQAALQNMVNAMNAKGAEGFEFKHMLTLNNPQGATTAAIIMQREKPVIYIPTGEQ